MKAATATTAALVLAVLAAAGCGNPFNGNGPGTSTADMQADAGPPRKNPEGRGADIRLFDGDPSSGPARRPRLWLHVDWLSFAEENVYSFENARAVIYGRDDQMEDMYLEAGEGMYQEAKSAYLKGGVVARIGDMTLELQDFEWLNDQGLGKSDNPVSITSPDSELKASSIRLYHKEKQIVLTDVTGTFRLERAQQ